MLLKYIESHLKCTEEEEENKKRNHLSHWNEKRKWREQCSKLCNTHAKQEENTQQNISNRSFVLFVHLFYSFYFGHFISAVKTNSFQFRCDWLFLFCERMPNVFACLVFMLLSCWLQLGSVGARDYITSIVYCLCHGHMRTNVRPTKHASYNVCILVYHVFLL